MVEIRVWEEDDLSGDFTVGESGTVELPLVGEIQVAGLTIDVVSANLRTKLESGFLVDPQVSVTIKVHASKPVLIQGAVREPGRYLLSRPTTLLDILAEAGGVLTDKGSQEVHLSRAELAEPMVIKLDGLMSGGIGNVELQSGDVIYIPENEIVHVAGQVLKPGAVIWRDGLTVVQAVTEAGGTSAGANLRKAYILRGSQRIELNLRRILRGVTADVVLEAGDQLFVDESVL